MNLFVPQELDYRFEALWVMQWLVGRHDEKSKIHRLFEEVEEEYALTEQEREQWLGPLKIILDEADQMLAEQLKDVERYFRVNEHNNVPSVADMLMWNHRKQEQMRNLTPEQQQTLHLTRLLSQMDYEDDDQLVNDLTTYLHGLERLECTDEQRWLYAQIGADPQSHWKRIEEVLSIAEAILRRHSAQLEPLFLAMAVECARRAETGELEKKLEEIGLKLDDIEVTVQISVMAFSALMAQIDSNELTRVFGAKQTTIIVYGFLVDELLERSRCVRKEKDKLLEILHALDDKTRWQILQELKDAPRYGQELVQLTGVSGATISHHMSELLSRQLVRMEKQGNRIVYYLQRERVREVLQDLENALL